MSGRARLGHRRRWHQHWAEHNTPMCRAFLVALGRWLAAHHDDRDAEITLPTGTVSAEELGRVLRALERARQAEVAP